MIPMIPFILVPLTWDLDYPSQPGDEYRIYRGIDCIARTEGIEAEVQLPPGSNILLVALYRNGKQEPMSAPLHVHIVIPEVSIQSSPNLMEWHEMPQPKDLYF
ncbi:MAG: hypothetical protein EOP85_00310, partial [Verrucomicrobiaceae bacterium]